MEQLQRLVVRYGECRQKPVRLRPKTWRPWLEPHGAARVLSLGTECSIGPRGDRLITRDDLATLRVRADGNPDGLRDLFVAVMIWGSGTSNGHGPRYTCRALSDSRMTQVLETTRKSVQAGELSSAYSQFTLNGVGRSFFTKWFAAVDPRDSECERALILDARVFRSLIALGWYSRKAAGTRRWPTRYATYVSTMHGWARRLGVSADRLEWLLFYLNGRVDAASEPCSSRAASAAHPAQEDKESIRPREERQHDR
ncbi:hypothetical protein ACFOSC_19575 [Streptantibioticus rubrisoli]|uniref:Uncharacterized protein n=1 Tax=Streptantibioticus rubrisoli TaxID=1387313 RepID=A0ABT1PK80_9ACTN|nr:hypothetical protein [Streptantibioticus rubrisoli]MCQ4045773.1 hypothetical protein [Streptantibioticus rubrisoli]